MALFSKKTEKDREVLLTKDFKLERQPEHPNIKKELNVVAVADAFVIGENKQKRTLLLDQLRKDLAANYKIIMDAEYDDDSESVHYAASAKMELYRILQQHWQDCHREYKNSNDDAEKYHAVCDALANMIDSEVLSENERLVCKRRLCDLVGKWIELRENEVTAQEYENYLRCLVELELYEEAQRLWLEKAAMLNSENAYSTMFKMFYQMGEKKKFEECLESLCKNRKIYLSHEGLEQLRYWRQRLSG